METYSVKQIAEMLNTQPETVRRWIRNGKLNAEKASRKDGHVVTEEDLNKFLKNSPKYAGITSGVVGMAAALSPIAAVPIVGGIAASALLVSSQLKKEQSEGKFSREDLKRFLIEEIERRNQSINQKLVTIEQLQREIAIDQQQVTECNLTLSQLNDKEDLDNDD